MGHASITTTLDLYGQLYPADMACEQTASTRWPDDEDDDPDAGDSER
jgi:hypothetical protein